MIFTTQEVRQILAGKKKRFTRPVQPADERSPKPHRFRVDIPIALQRPATAMELREDPSTKGMDVGQIIPTSVVRAELGQVTLIDAIAEGHSTTREFFEAWEETWPESKVRLDLAIWIVHFKLDTIATPRLLHRNSSRGYASTTTLGLAGEGEAVDARTLEHFVKDADERFAGQTGRREQLLRKRITALSKRLREDAITAAREGHDIEAELDAITSHLDLLQQRRAA